jgi:HAD superfamily hydrolase (TIGR01509 family)
MSDNRTIRGVVFDMDGVLVDSEEFICEAARRMFRERYGVEVPPEDFLPFVGAGENRYIGGPGEKHRIEMDIEVDKARTYEIYAEIVRGRLEPLTGARAFVSRLREEGVRTALATAADRVKAEVNLREIGIPAETFDAMVTGSDVERKKPHPDGFLLAVERLGLVPGECLVVEDAVNGCKAAKAAGCVCLGLTTSFDAETLAAAGADWTAPDLAHAPEGIV